MSTLTRRRVLIAGGAALLAACGGSGSTGDPPPDTGLRFLADGLPGRIVIRLRPSPAGLLAATDDGLYRRTAGGWQSCGLRGYWIHDVAAPGADVLIASGRPANDAAARSRLFESVDGGRQWSVIAHDFGGPAGEDAIQALAWDGAAARLLATGHDALAVSDDFGRHWTLLAGRWQGFASGKPALAFDPRRGDVWYGGQDAIEGFALFRWRPTALDAYPGLMPSPSIALGIRFAIDDPDRVLVSGEGGIVHTTDNGATWKRLLDAGHRFYFDALPDPRGTGRLVTAGWDKSFDLPQRLVVEWSDDDGAHWQRAEHPDPALFGGVWSMAATIEASRVVHWLGLYRGGVMRVEWPQDA